MYQRFGNSFPSKASYSNILLTVKVCVACLIALVISSLAPSIGLVGALVNAKNKGLLRSEGKEYVVNEGDVMEFLFNL